MLCEQTEMNFEASLRDRALDLHEITADTDLQRARYAVRQYAIENHGEEKYGVPYSATADDVRELREIQPDETGERGNNWMGAVFLERDNSGNRVWEPSGRRWHSRTRGSHANELQIWVLSQYYLHLIGATR